jgi:phosphoglycerate kinase
MGQAGMMRKRSLRDLDVAGKRVLLRADFNVPLAQDGDVRRVADDSRIRGAVPTIEYLREHGAAVIACSHLGRPRGVVRDELRLAPVADLLGRLIGAPVRTVDDCVGPDVEAAAAALAPGDVLLLENLRFHPEEEANDAGFAARLAAPADRYVNDAFGAAHRAHASVDAVARLLPSAAGLLLEAEIERLAGVFAGDGAVAFVSGGAKVSDKLGLLHSVVARADVLCIGGAMANTFLLANGTEVAASLAEPDMADEARAIQAEAEQHGCRLILPVDAVIAQGPDQPPRARPLQLAEETLPPDWRILDIGPRSIEQFGAALRDVGTVIWNGPMGLFEREAFAGGTRALARLLAGLRADVVVAGGETLAATAQAGVADRMAHRSTGGAAALALIEGRSLPGIEALPDA